VRTLTLLVLPHHVQGLCIHDPSDCWVTSGFFFAVCVIINMPMAVHNRHSSSEVNRKVQSRSKRRHWRLHLPPCQCLQHIQFILLRQLQQPRSHDPFHCGLFSFFLSAVLLPRMRQMGIQTIAYGHLFHLIIYNHHILFVHGVSPRARFGFNVMSPNLDLNFKSPYMHVLGANSCTAHLVNPSVLFSGTRFVSVYTMP
jgi:hypothetical protein